MKRFILALLFVGITATAFVTHVPALASGDPSLSNDPLGLNYGAATGLSDQDLRVSVARIIRFILGFLGLIFVVLVLYAGFRWMTSAGNEDAIAAAKKTLTAAIIGLAIILFAYGITTFVVRNLAEVATGEPYQTP